MSGHGGEQFRDFPWLHEFPFYGMRRSPNVDLQIRLRFLATHADTTILDRKHARGIVQEVHRLLRSDTLEFLSDVASPDNLTGALALYLSYREGSRVGSSASEKRRFFANWAPLLEPAMWLSVARSPWMSRLGAGLTLDLAEGLAPSLAGLQIAGLGHPARGAAAVLQIAGQYARRGTAKIMQKLRNRPYASARAQSLTVIEGLLRERRMRDLVLVSVEPCGLDAARVEALLNDPGSAEATGVLGALVSLGQLAREREVG
jgi:hypothetical protein